MISVCFICFHGLNELFFSAQRFHNFFIPVHLRFRVLVFLLHHLLNGLALVGQICGFHAVILRQLLCQLLWAFVRCFHIHPPGQQVAPCKGALCRPAGELRQFLVQLPYFVRIHLVLHARPCRRPRIRAVDPVRTVRHGVDGLTAEYQRDGAVVRVPLLCLHHRNGRRRHPAQFQRFLQVLFRQVVHCHKVFLAVHFHRRRQLEAPGFLHSILYYHHALDISFVIA